MKHKTKNELTPEQSDQLLDTLQERFTSNMHRHKDLKWPEVQEKLQAHPAKLWSLNQMEETGGQPDVVEIDNGTGAYVFCDCSPESPEGRRSVCYDREGLESRKKYKPDNNAVDMASDMGIELLTEDDYKALQQLENFDTKTSSWLKTPAGVRELGGAIFGDFRYERVFIYHNGAQSYYAARGFRGLLKV